ncbi:hypothetical protein ABK040_001129 [Willaertia magna]
MSRTEEIIELNEEDEFNDDNNREDNDVVDSESSDDEDSNDNTLWKIIWYLAITFFGGLFLFNKHSPIRWIFSKLLRRKTSSYPHPFLPSDNTSNISFIDRLFTSPFFEDDERVRLRPLSVNSYVNVFPTHENEDGIFVKVYIENSSELATENV